MTMPTRQQRALGGIEAALQASEPRLAAMFATFTRLHQVDGPVRREPLGRSRFYVITHRPEFVFAAVFAVMLAVGALMGVIGHRPANCQVNGEAATAATARAQPLTSCAPQSGVQPASRFGAAG
jgi:hypothetical protein